MEKRRRRRRRKKKRHGHDRGDRSGSYGPGISASSKTCAYVLFYLKQNICTSFDYAMFIL